MQQTGGRRQVQPGGWGSQLVREYNHKLSGSGENREAGMRQEGFREDRRQGNPAGGQEDRRRQRPAPGYNGPAAGGSDFERAGRQPGLQRDFTERRMYGAGPGGNTGASGMEDRAAGNVGQTERRGADASGRSGSRSLYQAGSRRMEPSGNTAAGEICRPAGYGGRGPDIRGEMAQAAGPAGGRDRQTERARQVLQPGGGRTQPGQTGSRGKGNSQGSGRRQLPPYETDRRRQPVRSGGERAGRAKKSGGGINFLVQGSILAAAGIVVRLIGMVYRIPLARKIGDVGNGYYNAAYSIYSILLIMSSYSLPTAVSKMVSARLAKGQYRTSTRIFRAAMFYATLAGMGGFCALWFGADYFANVVIKMPYSSYALKSLAPTIWIMAYLGVLRGYFQGHSTMIPTAVSQVFEQVVNAVVSIVAASVLFDMGVKSNLVFHDTQYSYAFGAAGGAIGTGAGAFTALILFLLLTMAYVPTMRKQAKRDRGGKAEGYGAISRALFVTIVPIIISSAIYNVSNVVDHSIFAHVMEGFGESSLTASQWGVYMGRYHMLFNIPVAIANSLSSSLIPSLSRAAAEKNRRQILSKIGSAIRFSMIIAVPSAVGLTVLAGPVSNLLFSGMDNEMLINMMAVGSSAVVFFSLSTVSNAILQGINRMQVPIINSAAALAVHVAVLFVMLSVFRMGIYSVVYSNILFAVLVCVLNAVSIARYTGYRQEVVKTFLIPAAASAVMGGCAWGVYRLCAGAGNGAATAAAILAAVFVYFVLLIRLKGVDEQELRSMPGGTRLLRAAKRLRLM